VICFIVGAAVGAVVALGILYAIAELSWQKVYEDAFR